MTKTAVYNLSKSKLAYAHPSTHIHEQYVWVKTHTQTFSSGKIVYLILNQCYIYRNKVSRLLDVHISIAEYINEVQKMCSYTFLYPATPVKTVMCDVERWGIDAKVNDTQSIGMFTFMNLDSKEMKYKKMHYKIQEKMSKVCFRKYEESFSYT